MRSNKNLFHTGSSSPARSWPSAPHTEILAVLVVRALFLVVFGVGISPRAQSQISQAADSVSTFTLDQCIRYAMQHQPNVNQALVNLSIAKKTNAVNLSGWFPQLSLSGTMVHYVQLPTTLEPNATPGGLPIATRTGVTDAATPELSASQAIFDPQLLYAAKSAPYLVKQAELMTDSARISLVAAVSKSFYNLLLILQQIDVLKEDTTRLGRTVVDTYHQYVGGIVDETDYEQAVITLNNSKAQLRQQVENVAAGYALLRQLMGYDPEQPLRVTFDTLRMMQEIYCDTTQPLRFEGRVEYQQLLTSEQLQHQQTEYRQLAFLPTVSAVYNYYYEYENMTASNLFRNAYPYSYVGLSFSLPLFTGLSRWENLQKAELQEEVVGWAKINLKSQIYSEYATALANYKSNLNSLHLLEDSRVRATNVYRVVSLQYKQGVVAYLNMIVAEANLITAEIGYIDALFQVLSSKIDLEQAMGNLSYQR